MNAAIQDFSRVEDLINPVTCQAYFNRVFLWGRSGTGKTPLAMAAAQYLPEDKRALLISTERGFRGDTPNADVIETRNIVEVERTLAYLLTQPHNYGLVVIDQWSDLFEIMQAAYADTDYSLPLDAWSPLRRAWRETILFPVLSIAAHVIVIAEAKHERIRHKGEVVGSKMVPNCEERDLGKFDVRLRVGWTQEPPSIGLFVERDRTLTKPSGETIEPSLEPWITGHDLQAPALGATGDYRSAVKAVEAARTLAGLEAVCEEYGSIWTRLPARARAFVNAATEGKKRECLGHLKTLCANHWARSKTPLEQLTAQWEGVFDQASLIALATRVSGCPCKKIEDVWVMTGLMAKRVFFEGAKKLPDWDFLEPSTQAPVVAAEAP